MDRLQINGIIVTVGAKMLENGYRHWLEGFLSCMEASAAGEDVFYWLRQGNQPKMDGTLQYVYLCIGGKIRFRCLYGGSRGPREVEFNDGRKMSAKAWIVLSGPVTRPPRPIKKQGFQGFRYTEMLF